MKSHCGNAAVYAVIIIITNSICCAFFSLGGAKKAGGTRGRVTPAPASGKGALMYLFSLVVDSSKNLLFIFHLPRLTPVQGL